MTPHIFDIEAEHFFPLPPIPGSERLVPITSWTEMFSEVQVTGVEFDEFWYESVEEGVAFFFRWTESPRSTILVVWNSERPIHIECRTIGDVLVPDEDSKLMLAEIFYLFRSAGYWQGEAYH